MKIVSREARLLAEAIFARACEVCSFCYPSEKQKTARSVVVLG